jgi:ferredoxin
MKLSIDPTKCTGQKRCFNLYPDLFEEGADGKGQVLATVTIVPEEEEINAQSAANACPSAAIVVEE